jgi:ubiquinone/menaquinone biosynthesis C-methylase UbiE
LSDLSLQQSTELCRLLADETRLRLLVLLEAFELSIAELTEVTALAQSRVSTHLSRLKRAGLVQDRRAGASALFSANLTRDGLAAELWAVLKSRVADRRIRLDAERAEGVIRARKHGQSWADSVAGRMELHYSPGRTWEATARALIGLLELGDVLDLGSGDGVLAELVAEHARSVTCADISEAVLLAARKRLHALPAIAYARADMHALPFDDAAYDQVFLMHALTYTREPQKVLAEAARVLRPKGRLIVAALAAHQHKETMRAYDHINLGVTPAALAKMLEQAGLAVESCRATSRETRPPYFSVVTAFAQRAR